MEVTNRFEWLNLIDRAPEEILMAVHAFVQEVVTKTIPKGKKKSNEEGNVVVLGGFTNS